MAESQNERPDRVLLECSFDRDSIWPLILRALSQLCSLQLDVDTKMEAAEMKVAEMEAAEMEAAEMEEAEMEATEMEAEAGSGDDEDGGRDGVGGGS
ncbi:hypothetical protein CBR_g9021 [Chara braunii]|uniref:Uncharacterized protein n=1 Tax=Chara braunii TaxID=69332 RepID=A0A388KNJ4_CHABU|nr:hypothetical protein CBR_g9021 [Chara braunii]|eukprot:GBG71605.1 hypothetical protein CBR_g9021 [Chara braunii]